jgi:hypothetical protein
MEAPTMYETHNPLLTPFVDGALVWLLDLPEAPEPWTLDDFTDLVPRFIELQ